MGKRHFIEGDTQMANKHEKDAQHRQPLEKCKLKSQRDLTIHVKIKSSDNMQWWPRCRETVIHTLPVGM